MGLARSLVLLENLMRYFPCPNNDLVADLFRFRACGLLAALTAMFYISRKGGNSRFAYICAGFLHAYRKPALSFRDSDRDVFLVCQDRATAGKLLQRAVSWRNGQSTSVFV